MPRFVAVDGEAIGQGDDERYALLCSSEGTHLWSAGGLRTRAILDYLLELSEPRTEIMCYGLNYDANQWLVDVPDSHLHELWEDGSTFWGWYKLEWVQGRYLIVSHTKRRQWAKIQEAFGFFSAPFIDALDQWSIPVPEHIIAGKRDRGSFEASDRRRITEYCRDECRLLVELMDKYGAAAKRAGCEPYSHQWIGGGALAGSLLREHGVLPHHQHDADLPGMTDAALEAVMTAYHGGRIEVFRQGTRQHIQTFDLRSAYPSATLHLPSMEGAKILRRARYRPSVLHAVWCAEWDVPEQEVMPLPVRSERAIWWPRSGSGWYHAAEVRAALGAGYPLRVGGGYELAPRPGGAPFGWIRDVYEDRRRLSQRGDPGERVLKLGMNAIYGKLAQGPTRYGGKTRTPKWQSYWWAGELTARVRAVMLEALLAVERPLFVATDGIYAHRGPYRQTQKLGGWKVGGVDEAFVIQPGVYEATNERTRVARASGFFSGDIDYAALRNLWDEDGQDGVHRYSSHRFTGLGVSIRRGNLDGWREWRDEPRSIFLRPRRKDSVHIDGDTVSLPKRFAPGESEPYVPRVLLEDSDSEAEAGLDQPLRVRV